MSLVDELIKSKYLKTPEIIKAFREINRRDFVREVDKEYSEKNIAMPIGCSQTISQPLVVAFMFELLQPWRGEKILDIGSGSGWTTAMLAHIVGDQGTVYSVERIEELKNLAEKNIDKYNFVKKARVHIFCSDGYEGLPDYYPFDKILISATSEELPNELLRQLKIGGTMVVPIGEQGKNQNIVCVKKILETKIEKQIFPGFIFVPLIKNN